MKLIHNGVRSACNTLGKQDAYIILVRKSQWNRPITRLGHRREDNIKINHL
jgi:hypothetical protein